MPDEIPVAPRRAAPTATQRARPMRVIGSQSLGAVLDRAVAQALARRLPRLRAQTVRDVQVLVRRGFRVLVRESARSVRGFTKKDFMKALERSQDRIYQARQQAVSELEELQRTTTLLRYLQEGDREELVRQEDQRTDRHRRALEGRMGEILARARRGELAPDELRTELVEAATQLARGEWERSLGWRWKGYDQEVDRYERRISKLSTSLERTESALGEIARLKEGDPGVASIYRTVQGLAEDVDQRELKHALLEQMFEANVVLQKGE